MDRYTVFASHSVTGRCRKVKKIRMYKKKNKNISQKCVFYSNGKIKKVNEILLLEIYKNVQYVCLYVICFVESRKKQFWHCAIRLHLESGRKAKKKRRKTPKYQQNSLTAWVNYGKISHTISKDTQMLPHCTVSIA